MKSTKGIKMIIDPYETMIGEIIKSGDLEKLLNRFLIDTTDKLLSYEYKSTNNVKYMFITGKNDHEQELPVFKHPIMFNDSIKNETYLFMDIRQFVNVRGVTHILNLKDIIKDFSNFKILLIRGIYQDILKHNPSYIFTYTDAIVGSIASLLGNVLGTALILNPKENTDLNITLIHYLLHMLDNDIESIPIKINRLSMARGENDYIREVLSRLDVPNNVDGLANNISKCSTSTKLLNVNSDMIFNLIRGIFYCDNSVELLSMMLEHPPTMISMLYNAYDDRTYRKTRLTTVLINNKKRVPIELMVKRVGNEVNDRTMV